MPNMALQEDLSKLYGQRAAFPSELEFFRKNSEGHPETVYDPNTNRYYAVQRR